MEKYKDYDTNPGNETIEDIIRRFEQAATDYLLIVLESKIIGGVRLYKEFDDMKLRISPIFILEKYQGKGYSQKVFILIEKIYSWVKIFKLDTIKEEKKLCYLYEKIGYVETAIYKKKKII